MTFFKKTYVTTIGTFVGDGSGLTNISASTATSAVSASYALTASYAMNGGGGGGSINTGSFATTGSNTFIGTQTVTGSIIATGEVIGSSFQGTASQAISASYASTASYVLGSIESASYALTASYAMNGGGGTPGGSTTQIQYNNGGTFDGVPTLIYSGGSLKATGSFSGSFIGNLQGTASWASNATTASYVQNAISASYAGIANSVNQLNQAVTVSGSLTVIGNATFLGSASFIYVTASQLDISASYISVNVFEPAERFGGLKVYDSGSPSHQATASLAWDSLLNHWVYQNASGSTYSGGMLLSGPRNTGSLGDEPSLTKWFIARSDGEDHLDNTQIYSSASIHIVTGSLTVTQGITGSLQGIADTASYITTAQTASYVLNAISSSYALTASYVQTAQTASYVLNAISSSYSLTASYAENAQTASYVNQAVSSSYAISASRADSIPLSGTGIGEIQFNTGGILNSSPRIYINSSILSVTNGATLNATGSLLGTSSYADQALSSSFAITASYTQTAQTASYVTTAQTASYVITAQTASYVTTAQTASYVLQAVSASFASTASKVTITNDTDNYILTANGNGTLNGESLLTFDGAKLSLLYQSGDEGGEILLNKPVTNTTLTGSGITIDSYQNKIRFFEQGGAARGAYIDITACAGGAGTNLLSGGGGATFNGGTNVNNRIVTATGTSPELNGEANLTFDGSTLAVTGSLITSQNVSIGTTLTTSPLTVISTSSPLITIQSTTANSYSNMRFSGTGRNYTIGVGNASETLFGVANEFFIYDDTAGAMRMTVDSSGNVGIGTTSPGSLLHVAGAISGSSITTTTNGYGISGSPNGVALTSTQVFATATTSISAATYADITGCSVSLAAGTWLITGTVIGAAANLIIQCFVAIRDGSNNVVAASAMSRPASGTANLNSPIGVSWSAIVTPAVTTTYKLSAARGLTTHTSTWTVYDGTGYNTANHATDNSDKGTNILAIRLA